MHVLILLFLLAIPCGYVLAVCQTWQEEERCASQAAANDRGNALSHKATAASSPSPSPGAFKNLPLPLLGGILRLAVHSGGAGAAARLNLVCRSFSAALPHAFSFSDDDDSPDLLSADSPSATFIDEVSHTWPGALPASPSDSLALTLDLDRLGSAAFVRRLAPAAAADCVRRTGTRFAQAHTLRVVALTPSCVRGAALFVKDAAPKLRAVRRLFIAGQLSSTYKPRWPSPVIFICDVVMNMVRSAWGPTRTRCPPASSLPPFWDKPTFAHAARGVRELSISGPFATLAPLAANLPDTFPAVTTLHLTLYTATPDFLCPDLTVKAPPGLRTLVLSVKAPSVRAEWDHSDPDNPRDLRPFTVTVSGRAGRLQQLYIHTCPWLAGPHRHWCRPLAIAGRLPALWQLDATVGRQGHNHALFPSLCTACPVLCRLVLRTAAFMVEVDGRAWGKALQALEPLAGRLEEVELWLGRALFGPGLLFMSHQEYLYFVRSSVMRAKVASLPTTHLSVFLAR